ncbi:hypothetical protein CORC01_10310 [Colletotrichum orchidophilum]|uniref:Uncharacterized protein n=1 Tax=Colletotrichum orchidophilum TaxID=1209926 RepID=A0A1G4AZB9_9PEZI|nr:uncharacterized protein CORC01_10310 [Colletotrichum orchidophilum]OHE94382.1 hypothetical protein CORC01_10310 [Colletotrichum orchidophilum]
MRQLDLETEHRDLGLGSRSNNGEENPDKLPPLSAPLADGWSTPETMKPSPINCPRNMVSFFDASIRRMEEQPPAQWYFGLKTFAAAAVAHYDFRQGGVGLGDRGGLRSSFCQESKFTSDSIMNEVSQDFDDNDETRVNNNMGVTVLHRSLKQILHATRGSLEFRNQEYRPLRAYCEAFYTYACEDCNESLVWAHAQLDFEGQRASRSSATKG